ncbi:hypothetical protein CAL28_27660 [Bordetella genomosp. 11]|uniref:Uncharacterized protein n=1 Tax=Bordetella genomosp. 11 TaxID=1416808 RepID=A0A261UPQ7_9BORD|nr:hypothetical protein CAL28_27660 [Bordetella genomosp. 11]
MISATAEYEPTDVAVDAMRRPQARIHGPVPHLTSILLPFLSHHRRASARRRQRVPAGCVAAAIERKASAFPTQHRYL